MIQGLASDQIYRFLLKAAFGKKSQQVKSEFERRIRNVARIKRLPVNTL
jgi:hypothetical protein